MNQTIKKNLPYLGIAVIGLVLLIGGSTFAYKSLNPKKLDNSRLSADDFGENGNPNSTGNNPSGRDNRGNWQGQGGQRPNFANMQRTSGTIKSISSHALVLTTPDGASKNVSITSGTQIMSFEDQRMNQESLSDLETGDTITVMSSDTSANPIVAQSIMVGQLPQRQNRSQGNNYGSGYGGGYGGGYGDDYSGGYGDEFNSTGTDSY